MLIFSYFASQNSRAVFTFWYWLILQKIEGEVRQEIDAAVKSAKTDPELSLSAMYDDIYAQPLPGHIVRGCDAFSYSTPQK